MTTAVIAPEKDEKPVILWATATGWGYPPVPGRGPMTMWATYWNPQALIDAHRKDEDE